jgi:hypothetical protein
MIVQNSNRKASVSRWPCRQNALKESTKKEFAIPFHAENR